MTVKSSVVYLFASSVLLLIFVVYWRQLSNDDSNSLQTTERLPEASTKLLKQCKEGYFFSQIDNSCLPCDKSSFSFKSWIGCHPWLDCNDIELNVRTRGLLSTASHNAVKTIYLADWHGYNVVYMKCSSIIYWDDCRHNTRMIKGLQGSELVVQLLGTCEEKQEVVTTYYQHGSSDRLNEILPHLNLDTNKELQLRIQLAQDYLRILVFLHSSPLGVRVMCDTNYLTKTLSQFLITDDFHLIVNDLDALPKVDHQLGQFIKCGHRELYGWFVAPEQLWPFDDKPFNDLKMPGYDEKIDIWRIPDVVLWFLGDSLNALRIKAKLKDVFSNCKAIDPKLRPNAREVLKIFNENIDQ